jgi:hypothetical protein
MARPVGTIKTWLRRARLEILQHLRLRGMIAEDSMDHSATPLPESGRRSS